MRATTHANSTEPRVRRSYGRRRAACLIGVYVLIAAHVAHWKLSGRTLAPLELNEVMYTLELGIVTAGFVFMSLAVVSVLIFGRFFCSWGCHILALQDLCEWLLGKLRIRPKPIRSRTLLLVPVGAMIYMFLWPQMQRFIRGEPAPRWRLTGDASGWASFLTDDFWRNLPPPGVALLTFIVCGVVIVYVLGTRSFCRYACPYGAIFALADRLAPGKIIARGDCSQCGKCTAACSSNIRVHEELTVFGRVVSPSCLKDLDCVAACPESNVAFGFTTPALFKSWTMRRHIRMPYDFSWFEDILIAIVFVACLFTFRGLYDSVPFLLALGIGGIVAYLSVVVLRLRSRANVRLNNLQFKLRGRLTPGGIAFALLFALLAMFVVHSGWIRYHEFTGNGAFARIVHASRTGVIDPASPNLAAGIEHLSICRGFGLFKPVYLDERLASMLILAERDAEAQRHVDRIAAGDPCRAHEVIADALASQGRDEAAQAHYEAAVKLDPQRMRVRLSLAQVLLNTGRFADAAEELAIAIKLDPDSPAGHWRLATALVAAGRCVESQSPAEEALRLAPSDANLHNSVGLLHARCGRWEDARQCFEAALDLDPQLESAREHLRHLDEQTRQVRR